MKAESLFAGYTPPPSTFDELVDERGEIRPAFTRCLEMLAGQPPEAFARAQALAEDALLHQGVTFSVYKDERGTEKIFPFCLIPRIVSAADWAVLDRGSASASPR